jgi:hypothetical protein
MDLNIHLEGVKKTRHATSLKIRCYLEGGNNLICFVPLSTQEVTPKLPYSYP